MLFTMFGYGFAKLCLSQFAPPSPARLDQPIGESTPMGILWTFMGASPAYCIFTGAVEVLVRHFQYAVYFCVHASRIQVLAVTHQRQSPGLWKSRA